MRRLILLLLLTACRRPEGLMFEPQPQAIHDGAAWAPRIVVRASGDLYALTARPAADGADLVFTSSLDGGDRFGSPLVVNAVPGEVRTHVGGAPLLLLGPRSVFYAVWAAPTALRVAKSTTYGKSFSAPVDIPTGLSSPPTFFSATVAPDGALLVVWFGANPAPKGPPGSTAISLASSKDGASFEVLQGIAGGVCPCCRPAVIADEQGRWFVSYRAVLGKVRDIVMTTSADRGARWSEPWQVSKDGWKIEGCPHSGPALAVAGEAVYVAWYSEAEGVPRLYWTRTADGRAFEPRRRLSAELLDANQPVLAVDGDQVFAAFLGRDPEARGGWAPLGVYTRRLDDDAEPPARVPGTQGSAAAPELKPISAGRWLVAWTENGETSAARLSRARLKR